MTNDVLDDCAGFQRINKCSILDRKVKTYTHELFAPIWLQANFKMDLETNINEIPHNFERLGCERD